MDFLELKTSALTFDNNIVYWKQDTNTIECYGMLSQKVVQRANVNDFSNGQITRIVISDDN